MSDHGEAGAGRRASFADRMIGGVGAAVIAVTLFGVRIWARLTRTPYYDD